jgi:cyclophilin family peptidyl-prolyl cis-trans isomerase
MRPSTVIPTFAMVFAATAVYPAAAQQRQGGAPPQAPTQRPQRTEQEARDVAARLRAERGRQREAGSPMELIPSYVSASIGPVPESLGVSSFYTKYADAHGIPVISSAKVPDDALLVARDIVNSMLAARPDLRKAMIARKWRTGVIAEVEMTMDIPEYARMKRPGAPAGEPVVPADRDYHAWRSRGLGGNPTTGAEENLLGYPGTRYFGEHIFVHEFAHAIMGGGIRDVDPAMHAEIRAAYDSAMAAGKYVHPDGRRHYATTNPGEYWAEGAQWWFFSNYGECFAGNIVVETPEDLATYDPKLFELLGRVFTTHRIPMDVFHGRRVRPVRCPPQPGDSRQALLLHPGDSAWRAPAPAVSHLRFETTKGVFVLELVREWGPIGADRLYNLARLGYYDDTRVHRVNRGYIAQWGLHGNPAVNAAWKDRPIRDDPPRPGNLRGTFAFAMTGPDTRRTQIYINLGDNSRNDAEPFTILGRVIEGMSVVDSLYAGYGENSGSGMRQGRQGPLETGGNAFMDKEYPLLDRIIRVTVTRPRP